MSPSEAVWLSGLFLGLALGLPMGVLTDRLLLRPVARFLALTGYDRRR